MRNFIYAAAALAVAGLAPLATPSPARADIEYPFCGFGREGSGGCTFSTMEQCRAFISGAGGDCKINPRYTPNTPATRPRR